MRETYDFKEAWPESRNEMGDLSVSRYQERRGSRGDTFS